MIDCFPSALQPDGPYSIFASPLANGRKLCRPLKLCLLTTGDIIPTKEGWGWQDQSEGKGIEDPVNGKGESPCIELGEVPTLLLLDVTKQDGEAIETVLTPSLENGMSTVAEEAAGSLTEVEEKPEELM